MHAVVLNPDDLGADYASGIRTMIEAFITWAPPEMSVSLVGVTDDPAARPVGQWQRVPVGGRPVDFLPILATHPSLRPRVPVSLQFTWQLRRWRRKIDFGDAVLLFHRLEPAWPLLDLPNPKLMFLHYAVQDQVLNDSSEVRWRRFPWLYFWLERRILPRVDRLWSERSDGIVWWQEHYPEIAGRAAFLPTWADERRFRIFPEQQRGRCRDELCREYGIPPAPKLAFFAGRFESQKDPLLLLNAWSLLPAAFQDAHLALAGEGSLEPEMRALVAEKGLGGRVHFVGRQSAERVAEWLNAADAFVMSSAFEGMSLAMIEAVSCGTPVASPAVGEARRLVTHPAAGRLIEERSPAALALAIAEVLAQPRDREACAACAEPFTPRKVLEPVYAFCREHAAGKAAG